MTEKRKKILIPITVLIAAILVSVAFIMPSARGAISVNAEYSLELDSEIKSSYMVGETVHIPNGIFKGESDISADFTVRLPDGSAMKSSDITLSKAGVYKIVYTASVGNETLRTEKSFTAYGEKYSVDKSTSSVEYRNNQKFVNTKTGEVTEAEGLFVSLSEGSVFTYNKVIDISEATKDDILFSCNIVSNEDGQADFITLNVRFTDVYDESNYFDVVLWRNGNSDETTYMRAGAAGQTDSGWNSNENKLHVGKYGTFTRCSFQNTPFSGDRNGDTMDIALNYGDRSIWGARYGNNNGFIIDLDDPEYFSTLWNGFTTGECKVSVFMDRYVTASGNVFIRKIGQDSGSLFASNVLSEISSPVIDVDFGGYTENDLPFAVVGSEYPVFDASVKTVGNEVAFFNTRVYYNYHSDNKIAVSLKNGKFIPQYYGPYTIEYSVADAFGRTFTRLAEVECIEADASPLMISLSAAPASDGTTGENISVAGYSVSGNSGNYQVKITASNGSVTYDVGDDLKFLPMKSGVFKIEYSVTDYTGRDSKESYNITVNPETAPVFISGVKLPKYLLSGFMQTLPELNAYDFVADREIPSEIYIKENGGSERKLDGRAYTPTVNGNYIAEIIYRAVANGKTTDETYRVECRSVLKGTDNTKIEKKNLFVTDDAVTSAYENLSGRANDYTYYAVYSASTDAGIEYINRVPAQGFGLRFNIFESGNDFEEMRFTLTDSDNENISVVLSYFNRKGGATVSVCGGTEFPLSSVSFDSQSTGIEFEFDNINKTFTADNGKSVLTVTSDMDGNEFSGFPSGKVYLRADFVGVNTQAKIAVQRIYNQQLTDSPSDTANPILALDGEYEKYYSLGSEIKIFRAVYLDMITPELNVIMSVKDPSGNVMTALDGTLLSGADIEKEYTVSLNSFGRYSVVYRLESGAEISYTFTVADEDPPTISVEGDIAKSYYVGDSVELKATATDELSDCNIFAYMVDSTNKLVNLTVGETYRFEKAGRHELTFWAMDENANCSYKTFVINVSEK